MQRELARGETQNQIMKSEILETRTGINHTHVNEVSPFTVTKLVGNVKYTLERNQFFTDWVVTGRDAAGELHSININRSGLGGESRFCGNF